MQFHRSPRQREHVSIDITNFVDVILTLLVFFIISASFEHTGSIRVNLPKASSEATAKDAKDDTITIAVSERGEISLNDERISREDLKVALAARARGIPDAKVVLRADQAVPHGDVVRVLDIVKGIGITRIAIATQMESVR